MKKIGAITIGQAPRTDISEDIGDILGSDIELIQAGALDGLTIEEVKRLNPDGTGTTLVSRMRDGTAVTLQEQKILPLMQQRIDDLESQGVGAILILCTGEFPETFLSKVPLIYPSKVICGIVAALNNVSRIGVVTPDQDQIEDIKKKWGKIVETVIPVQWNPYLKKKSEQAASQLRDANVDLAVMDCFGYSSGMREFLAERISKPVILSRTIAARILREIA
ncbi:AroM family protein [Oscillibacter sp. MSJ-2]|uniref:AroM family protein n=1 Tax=Dysosmobacter acutus TaxID=2841504 RepID=A0ABS6FA43_9FIRM|nr:AroM family protein [Dysosmobacter acutus]